MDPKLLNESVNLLEHDLRVASNLRIVGSLVLVVAVVLAIFEVKVGAKKKST